MEESIKIEKIKKSCNVGEKVTTVFCIIAIVGCVLSLIAGFVILNMGKEFDNKFAALNQYGHASLGSNLGGIKLLHIDLSDTSNLESDIPAISEAIKDHPYAMEASMMTFMVSLMTAIIAVMFKLIGSVFSLIRKENNPFTDKVIRRIVIVMAVLSVIIFFSSGMSSGILGGILTWVVYTVLDYGRTLQIQVDETL